MSFTRSLLVLCCWVLALQLSAQAYGTVTGQVIDQRSGKPIAGAIVELPNHSPMRSTTTDKNGFFSISGIPVGTDRLRILAPEHEPQTLYSIPVDSAFATEVAVEMERERNRMTAKPIPEELIEERKQRQAPITLEGRYAYSPAAPVLEAGAAAEQDLHLLLQARPELQRPTAWHSGLGLNGLPTNGSKVYLNDLPFEGALANTGLGHQLGPASVLSPDRLGKVSLHRRILPANYGNAHGAVIDAQLAKGKVGPLSGTLGLGLQRSQLGLEGLLSARHKSTFKISGNYNNGHLLLQPAYRALPASGDLSFTLSFPGRGQHWEIFGLAQQIDVQSAPTDSLSIRHFMWEQAADQHLRGRRQAGIGGLRWTNSLSEQSYLRSSLAVEVLSSHMRWQSRPFEELEEQAPAREYAFQRTSVLSHSFYKWRSGESQKVQIGFLANLRSLNFWQLDSSQQANFYVHQTNQILAETQLYATLSQQLSQAWDTEIGLHLRWNSLTQRFFVEPRLNMCWNIAPKNEMHVGYSWQAQDLPTALQFYRPPILRGPNQVQAYDEQNLALEASQQHRWRLDYIGMLARQWELQLSGFLAYYTDIPVSNGATSFSWAQQNQLLPHYAFLGLESSGTARTTGLSVQLEKRWSNDWVAWANATFQDPRYQAETGVYNTRPGSQLLANFFLSYQAKLGTRGSYIELRPHFHWQSRRRYLPIDEAASLAAGSTVRDGSRGAAAKLSPFYQLDVQVMAHFKPVMGRLGHIIGFSINNLLNRKNIVDYYYDVQSERIRSVTMLGLVPHLNYRIKF